MYIQSNPYIVSKAANLQPLHVLQGQKPKAHYYFTFWDSTISVFMKFLWNQTMFWAISTHGSQKSAANQKNREKTISVRLNFEVLLNQIVLYERFHMRLCNLHMNLNLWIHKIFCMSDCMGMKNQLTFMFNGGQKLPFFSFFFLLENVALKLQQFFVCSHAEKFYDHLTTTYENFIKINKTFTT